MNVFDNSESRTSVIILENHPADSRVTICEDGVFQTLSSRMGTGGGNVPLVLITQEDVRNDISEDNGNTESGSASGRM